jgi:VCBS repeat-containing protein
MSPIDGTPDNDTLTGTADPDLIRGLAGNDRLNGLAGDDTLDGGAGTNQIDAGEGNDTVLLDGTAFSTNVHVPATGIDGGAGTDTISFAGVVADFHIVQIVGGSLQVTDLTTGARTIAVNVEHLLFSDTDVWLDPPPNADPVVTGDLTGGVVEDASLVATGQLTVTDGDAGQSGMVAVVGLAGTYGSLTVDAAGAWTYALDNNALAVQSLTGGQVVTDVLTLQTMDGTAVEVTVTVTGAADSDLILGTAAADRLTGTAGVDHIFGEDGRDRITGKGGADVLSGGADGDRFVFNGNFGQDIITDFDTLQKGETISLAGVDGLRGFLDLVAHHLSEVGGDAVISVGGNTLTLQGVTANSLTAGDFLF